MSTTQNAQVSIKKLPIKYSCEKCFFFFRYNPTTDKLEPSVVTFMDKDLKFLSKIMFYIFRKLRFIKVKETIVETKEHKEVQYESTNFTIINFALTILGPTHEKMLTIILLIVQVSFLFQHQLFV